MLALDADAAGVVVLSRGGGGGDDDPLQLDRLDPTGAVLHSVMLPWQATDTTQVRLLDADRALVHGVRAGDGTQVVVGMASGQAVGANVHSFVYAPAGIGLSDGLVWFPSAYPGEVVHARLDATSGLVELRRAVVSEDWLHDVQPLDASTALVAGHLRGLGLVTLGDGSAGGDANDDVRYEPLWERLWSYSLVGERHAYSATGAFLLCVDPATHATRELPIPGFQETPALPNTTPIGERAPGRVLLHQAGAGLVELDCEGSPEA